MKRPKPKKHQRAQFAPSAKQKSAVYVPVAQRRSEAQRDAAALDAYLARHHVTQPPPMPRQPRTRTSGELSLASDRHLGLIR